MNINKETRKQNRLEKLGTNEPRCKVCGESDWRCLEKHHIAGKDYDDDTATICRNCHRKLSDDQKDHPQKLEKKPDTLESIGHLLLGIADLFALLVDKLRECGEFLISSAKEMVVA
jgi:hypothetical protein